VAKPAAPSAVPVAARGAKPTSPGVKRIDVPSATAGASDEAKPFAIDPSQSLADQLAAVGVNRGDAQAAERAVTEALKGAALAVGSTGRAALTPGVSPVRLQGLQIFGPTGPVADIERMADGKFTAKSVAAPSSRPAAQNTDLADASAVQDDPRAWSAPDRQAAVTVRSARNVAQATVGLRRVSANGDPNVALARAGVDSGTARSAALALAAVAPASLDRRSANIELVHGRMDDGETRLLTATIYDRSSRGQVWWFAPKGQPEGYFDEHGNRLGDAGMAMPVDGSHVSSPFGIRRFGRWAAFHNGVDIAGRMGTPIIAAADGVVDYVGWYYGYGKTVRVLHNESLATSYSHMSTYAPGVGPGTRVRKGQLIGYVGSTGRSTGPHLHFCVLVNGNFVNPAPYISGGGGRLGPQDLVSFREWQRATAGMARSAPSRRASDSDMDGNNRL
jgi:murein DD-endopeptidase MepM/ murein hydrolase activator NlpD